MSDTFDRVRVRIAPSPTGDPHVGTAYIGLFNYAFARHAGGDFILRIEDTDRERSTSESEAAILRAMRWIGLRYEEGPDIGGPCGPYRQSERSELYRKHAEELVGKGAAYRCFCSSERLTELRKRQLAEKKFVGYDGCCRDLGADAVRGKVAAGTPHTIRLKTPRDGETRFTDLVRGEVAFANAQIDEQVLLKSDGFPTYHLANVVDDHLMRISHVIRAEEWISSTPKHVLLYQAFGWEMPTFIHMPLLRNKNKSKISKRKDPTSLDWYREQGYLPEALLNFLALMGWSMGDDREVFTLAEMVRSFTWDRVKTSGPVFDIEKLDWLNGEYIRAMSAEALLERILAGPYTRRTDAPASRLLPIAKLAQPRLTKLSEFDALVNYFFEAESYEAAELTPKKGKGPAPLEVLQALAQAFEAEEDWRTQALDAAAQGVCDARGWTRGEAYMILRVAVTCRRVSTPLFETMEILGKDECCARIATAMGKLRTPSTQ